MAHALSDHARKQPSQAPTPQPVADVESTHPLLWPVAIWLAQSIICIKLIDDFHESSPIVSHAALVIMLLIFATAMGPRCRNGIRRHRFQWLLAWTATLLTYGMLEGGLSLLYRQGVIDLFAKKSFIMLYENSQGTISFDPVRGYRLSQQPTRFARVTSDRAEYVGVLRGNAQGFPDRDDFSPRKTDRQRLRFAVFGDSFTAAQYLEKNWPDQVEDLLSQSDKEIELYNFSIDGGGLINWWSVITKYIAVENYEFDGVIFAVYPADLSRRFLVSDHTGGKPLMGRVNAWDPAKLPVTLAEATPHMHSHGLIVDTKQFDGMIDGSIRPRRMWLPYLATNYQLLVDELRATHRQQIAERQLLDFPPRQHYVDEIHSFVFDNHLPAMVVHIPKKMNRDGMDQETGIPVETARFAHELGETLLDGREAFTDLDGDERADCWFDDDPHWNQRGSDRFAEYVANRLTEWSNELRKNRRIDMQE